MMSAWVVLAVSLKTVQQDLEILMVSLLAWQYWMVELMDWLMPVREVEKLQMSSANWMDGTGRSWSLGGVQPILKVKMRPAIKRLYNKGDRGSPWRRPTFDVKGLAGLVPSLIRAEVLVYVFYTRRQNLGPSPQMTILQKRRGRQTLS